MQPYDETLDILLNGLFFQNRCMGYGEDQLIQTAYSLIKTIHPNIQFDQYLSQYYPQINEMERTVVDTMLKEYANEEPLIQDLITVFQERQKALQNPTPKLAPFVPERVERNPHTI